MRKIIVTEFDIRSALGHSGASPLADALINRLFYHHSIDSAQELETRVTTLEKQVKTLSKRKTK